MATTFWFNARGLVSLELPLPHQFEPKTTGWDATFGGAGTLVARSLQGTELRVDIAAGDRLISRAGELYLQRKP